MKSQNIVMACGSIANLFFKVLTICSTWKKVVSHPSVGIAVVALQGEIYRNTITVFVEASGTTLYSTGLSLCPWTVFPQKMKGKGVGTPKIKKIQTIVLKWLERPDLKLWNQLSLLSVFFMCSMHISCDGWTFDA